jgi:hypothetical protein
MRVVYEAGQLFDAYIVRHALEDAGIPVFIRGESLVGGVGELPASGLLAVCVPEAAWAEARAIVETLAGALDLATGGSPACDNPGDEQGEGDGIAVPA